jgi:hypothetical protein
MTTIQSKPVNDFDWEIWKIEQNRNYFNETFENEK